ncbi:MAG: tRNA (adenosine(37)-N6)-threonylcarbamoyltransferase complex dimerization subunit type 1 TsaB [Anaerolineae bacterium]|nr:tRNA (adenosine(37)-N6)-threonylcarbamoyltransferase complex dimerization subunit type 1 TsaB [Anaerolineae bacterium]
MILAIDTATRFISLALHDGQRLLLEHTWLTANNHTVELAPAIHAAFAQTRIVPSSLSAVAISQGPGSFTGLRIGMGVAKGLALATGCPLVAVPTLEIVAAAVPAAPEPLVAVLQAGRGRVCAQTFRASGGHWQPAGPPAIVTWEGLFAALDGAALLAGEIDDGGREVLDASRQPVRVLPAAIALRRAGFLAEMALSRLAAGQRADPRAVTPIYLHQPGAAQS